MIKSTIKLLLKKTGYKLVKVSKAESGLASNKGSSKSEEVKEWIRNISEAPLNANLHLEYANYASKNNRPYLAYAELKTACFLGANQERAESQKFKYINALPNPLCLSHNLYARCKSLASEIILKASDENSVISILDVGGGQGHLAAFLPDNFKYCLAEPSANGISGHNLPFPDHSFDYVVSCHVLEHIPIDQRGIFLDQLVAKSRHGVFLLNPFNVDGTYPNERSVLIAEITGADWAKEHLDCIFPKIEDIKNYAAKRELEFSAKPNGMFTTGLAWIFVDHFALKAGLHKEWEKLNTFFNERYTNVFDRGNNYSAYLVYLGRRN